ncbi:MAG: hypothetical protein ACRCWF_03000 [Beijerinckiaceae bacterium]
MSNIRHVSFAPTVNNTLVIMLEDLLDRAKSGDIVSGGFSGTKADGSISTAFSSSDNAIAELAAISHLLYRLHASMETP